MKIILFTNTNINKFEFLPIHNEQIANKKVNLT